MQKHVPCPVRRHGGMRPVHPEGVSHGSSGGVSLVTSADRLSARRGEGMPPAAPDPRLTRAAPAATSPRRPRARAEAAGVAAEGIPSPRRVRGRIRCGRRAAGRRDRRDRKSTRLNSSHRTISYAVFCLKKKKKDEGIVLEEEDSKKGRWK